MPERGFLVVLGELWDKLFNRIDWTLIWSQRGHLWDGVKMTLIIALIAGVIGVLMGLFFAIVRLNKRWYLWFPAAAYIDAFRCTPLFVQIFFAHFAVVPALAEIKDVLGVFPAWEMARLPAVYTGVFTMGLNSAAYLAEIFRGGILSIDKGQREAAISLGMREYQAMGYVVLPQAMTNCLPSVGNEFITLIKDSSLLSALSVTELMFQAGLIASRSYDYFSMYFGILLIYFGLCFPMARAMARLEKKMRTGQK